MLHCYISHCFFWPVPRPVCRTLLWLDTYDEDVYKGHSGTCIFCIIAQPSVERANKLLPYIRNKLTTEPVTFSCFFRAYLHPSMSYWPFRSFTVVNIKAYVYSRHLFLQSATLPIAGGHAQDVPNKPQPFFSHKDLTSSEKTTSSDRRITCS